MSERGSVLIVDDNENLCKTLSFILNRKGYTTTTAHDGPDAIKQTEETPFDLTLMDIKMPLMNGVEAYKKIKRLRPKAAVVMMTAYSVEELVQEALEEGAFGIIYKPLDIDKVISLIEEVKTARKGALILVLEDDEGTRDALRVELEKREYTLGFAGSGDEAVALVQERRFDVLLVDLKLSFVNSFELYLAVKEIQPDIVAIIWTADAQGLKELAESALQNDAYTCVNKPLVVEDVLKLLDEVMLKKQVTG